MTQATRVRSPAEANLMFFHSLAVRVPACHAGGPGSIPGRCSSIFGIWREVLGRNVYITSQYFFPAIIYRDIISHITSTYRYIMYFFRTFKKSTAPYKVHNMGLRYIKDFSIVSVIYVFIYFFEIRHLLSAGLSALQSYI